MWPFSRSIAKWVHERKPGQFRKPSRLWVEPLEDRILLSTVFWNNPAGGDWGRLDNWVDDQGVHRQPGPDDDVVISGVNADATVTHVGRADTIATLTSSNVTPYTLALSSGPLALAGTAPSLFNGNTHLVLAGFPLELRSTLTVEGQADVGNCTISRLVDPRGGPQANNSNSSVKWGGDVDFQADAKWDWLGPRVHIGLGGHFHFGSPGNNRAQLDLLDGSDLTIESGASFFMSSNGTIFSNDYTGGTITVDEGALFQKDSGGGTAQVYLPLENAGTVDVQKGTLNLAAGGQGSGNFTVDTEGTLQFGGRTNLLTSDSSVRGDGTVVVSASLTQVLGSYDVANTVISGGSLQLSGDVHAGQSILVQGTFGHNATLTALNSFTNAGTITLDSTDGWNANLAVNNNGTLTNAGTLSVNVGSGGGRSLTLNLVNDGEGTVNLNQNTTFDKQDGSYTNNGAFTIAAGKTLTINTGSPVFNQDGGTLNVIGTFSQTGGAFNFNGGAPAGNPLQLTTVALTIAQDAREAASFTVYRVCTLSGDVHTGQSIVVEGVFGGNATLTAADSFRNDGTLTLDSTGWNANLAVNNNGTLTNAGTLSVNVGSGGGRSLTLNLVNDGEGTVNLNQNTTFDKQDGSYTNNGAFTIVAGKTLTVNTASNGYPTFTQNGGTLTCNGSYVQSHGAFNFNGGMLAGNPLQLSNVALSISPDATAAASFTVHNSCTLSGDIDAGQSILVQATFGQNATLTALNSFNNTGTITLDSTDGWNANLAVNKNGTLTNAGTLSVNVGSGGSRTLSLNLVNSDEGTINLNQNTTFDKQNGSYTNNGAFTVVAGKTLTIANGSPVFNQDGGTLNVLGNYLQTAGDFHFDGGTLSIGPASVLAVGGNYTQGSAATLEIQLGGMPGTGLFGRLAVGGTAALDGTLTLTLVNGYSPMTGDTFPVVTFASATGTFATLAGDASQFTIAYDPMDVTFVAN
jgi:flagellar basal body rod protein FlgG